MATSTRDGLGMSVLFRRGLRPRALNLAAGAALSIAAIAAPAKAQFVWANNTSTTPQNWSVATNWSGPAPVAGGSINDTVSLGYNFGSGAFASNLDLAGAYALNALTLNAQAAGGFTLSATAGSTLNFSTNGAAVGPSITNSSSSAGTISGLITLSNNTSIVGSGSGALTLSGAISGPGALVLGTTGSGVVTLSGANTCAGGTTINSGEVGVGNATGLGPAGSTVTINGGRLRVNSAAALILSQNFSLNSNLTLTGPNTSVVNHTFSGSLSGAGGITNRITVSSTTIFNAASGFTGAYDGQAFGNSVPSVTLNGNGAWTGVSSLRLEANQTLTLDNAATNVLNRINDAAPLNLYRAGLTLTGNAGAGSSESVGALTYSGSISLATVPNAAQNTTLNIASFSRSNRASLVLTGTNLGGAGANSSNIFSGAGDVAADLVGGGGAAGTTNISIVPYGYAVNTVGTASGQLMTYTAANGFRPLTAAEYIPSLTGARNTNTTNNLKAPGASAVKGYTTANSLTIDSASAATVGAGVYGGGGFKPTSGAVLFSISGGATASTLPSIMAVASLDFGSAEGIIHSQNLSAVTSPITGSNGLTKAGFGQLFLAGNNTYTGTTTVDGSILHISSDSALGNAANGIVLAGGNVSGINFTPSVLFGDVSIQSLTISRPITLAEAGGGLSAVLNNTTLTASGVISGPGRLLTGTGFLGNTGVLKLTNTNTYGGPTVIFGNVAITSDAALGTNSEVVGTGGFLRADGPVTSNRNFTLTGSMPFVTNGFDMTLNGTIANQAAAAGTVSKGGTNTLTLTGNSQFNGALQVGLTGPLGNMDHLETGGTVILSGASGALTAVTAANVLSGATLVLDNTGANNGNRLNANVTVGGGTFEFRGNAGAASTETIGTLSAGNFAPAVGNGVGIVNIVPGAAQSAVVTASNFTRTGAAAMLVRSPNLGGAIGAGTGNLVFNTAPTLTGTGPGVMAGVVGDTSVVGTGSDFVTHVAGTGVRLLTAGEYSAFPLAGGTTTAVDVSAPIAPMTAAQSINALRITGGAGASVDLGGFVLTNASGMIMSTGGANAGINGAAGSGLAFAAVPATFWTNDNLSLAAGLTMTGSAGLNKAGPGNLTINSATALTGGAIISNGRLIYGVANALAIGNAVTVGTTGSALGVLDLNGTSSQIGGLGGFGNVELNGGNLTTTGTAQFNGSINGAGNLILGTSTLTSSQTLTGVSSFVGQVRVTNGTLTLTANQPAVGTGGLGAAGNTVVLGDVPLATTFGTLTPGANVGRIAADITVNGAAIAANATTSTINSAANNNAILSGNIAVNRLLRLSGSNPSTTGFGGSNIYTGTISDGSQPGGIDWFNGSHSLWGNNTFSGGIFLNSTSSSYMGLGSNTALGTGFIKIASLSGNFHADNGARTIANDTYYTSSSSTPLGLVGLNDFTFTGQWDLGGGAFVGQPVPSVAGPRTIRVLNKFTTLSGVISGTSAATLTKEGGGTLVMSNALNTFAGTVAVNAGSLLVNGSNTGGGAYTVAAGALIGGSGSIAPSAVSIATNAALEPGNSAGTFTSGAMTLANLSIMMWELGDSTIPTASDLAAVQGNLSVAGGTGAVVLNIEALPGWALLPGTTSWTIMTYTGTLTGTPANFVFGNMPFGVTGATIDTTTVPGAVILNLVPTPGSASVLLLAGAFAARRRRARSC